jgi:hypothetical protein
VQVRSLVLRHDESDTDQYLSLKERETALGAMETLDPRPTNCRGIEGCAVTKSRLGTARLLPRDLCPLVKKVERNRVAMRSCKAHRGIFRSGNSYR